MADATALQALTAAVHNQSAQLSSELSTMRAAIDTYQNRAAAMETSIGVLSEAQTKTYEDMQSMITNISTSWETRFHGLEQRIEENRTHHEYSDEQMEDPEKFSRVQAMIDGKVASLQNQLNSLSRP
eukprot:7132532-Pyramimonas_sp.AAC.1